MEFTEPNHIDRMIYKLQELSDRIYAYDDTYDDAFDVVARNIERDFQSIISDLRGLYKEDSTQFSERQIEHIQRLKHEFIQNKKKEFPKIKTPSPTERPPHFVSGGSPGQGKRS